MDQLNFIIMTTIWLLFLVFILLQPDRCSLIHSPRGRLAVYHGLQANWIKTCINNLTIYSVTADGEHCCEKPSLKNY